MVPYDNTLYIDTVYRYIKIKMLFFKMEIKFWAIKHVLIFIKNLIRIQIPDTAPDPEGRWKQIQYADTILKL